MRNTKQYEFKTSSTEGYNEFDIKQIARNKRREGRKKLLLRILVFLLLVGILFLFLKSSYFSVKDVKVEGMNYYSANEIIGMSGIKMGENILFDVKKSDIVDNLQKNSYFKSVNVKRRIPSTLVVEVEERPQTAAVIFGDSYIVIDDEGIVLRKANVDPRITLLTGLTISKMTIGEPLEAEERESLVMTLRMLDTMSDGDIYFKKIDVSKVVIKAYVYDNLVVKATPSEITSAIESGDLQKVILDLFNDGVSRGTITMGGSSYISFSPELEED